MNLSHRQSCRLEGEYLLELPAILAIHELDERLIEQCPWGDLETTVGYCVDRSGQMPAGSVSDRGAGAAQSVVLV